MATKARITPDDLFEISDRDHRYELVNGEVIKMPPPGFLHGDVVARTAHRLSDFVNRSRAGIVVVGSGCILELPGDPDRSALCRTCGAHFFRRDPIPAFTRLSQN